MQQFVPKRAVSADGSSISCRTMLALIEFVQMLTCTREAAYSATSAKSASGSAPATFTKRTWGLSAASGWKGRAFAAVAKATDARANAKLRIEN